MGRALSHSAVECRVLWNQLPELGQDYCRLAERFESAAVQLLLSPVLLQEARWRLALSVTLAPCSREPKTQCAQTTLSGATQACEEGDEQE